VIMRTAGASVVRANGRRVQHRVLRDATLFAIGNDYECVISGSVNGKPGARHNHSHSNSIRLNITATTNGVSLQNWSAKS
jgi:hypothetical protein